VQSLQTTARPPSNGHGYHRHGNLQPQGPMFHLGHLGTQYFLRLQSLPPRRSTNHAAPIIPGGHGAWWRLTVLPCDLAPTTTWIAGIASNADMMGSELQPRASRGQGLINSCAVHQVGHGKAQRLPHLLLADPFRSTLQTHLALQNELVTFPLVWRSTQ
jgi:hypothetical protein